MKMVGLKSQTHTVYNIETVKTIDDSSPLLPNQTYSVQRRFSDFEQLFAYFKSMKNLKGLVIPELPQKAFFNQDSTLIERRRKCLEQFLQSLISNPKIREIQAFQFFLTE